MLEASASSLRRMEETEYARMSRPSKELHHAVKAGWVSVLKMLLWAPGARVDARDGSKRTALHYACKSDHKDAERVVKVLLKAGAAVDAPDGSKRTALHYVCEAGHKDAERVVKMLLRAGAVVNAQDESGRTPLHVACQSDHENAERIVDMLLRAGAVVNAEDGSGMTPLHEACRKMKIRYWKTERSGQEKRKIKKTFIKHVMKQRSLNLPEAFYTKQRTGDDFYDKVRYRCCQELEVMKSTKVVKDVSLYDVLWHINQPYHLSLGDIHKIGKVITSPCLKKQFPLYYHSLVTAFQRAMLLTWAVHSFYSECRKMKVFPHIVAEQLLVLLSNEDLKSFLLSDSKK